MLLAPILYQYFLREFAMAMIRMRSVDEFFGARQVLNGISIEIEEGEIFGLLGPSGAGKTTLIRILVGLLPPSCGMITVMGKEPSKYDSDVYASFGMVLDNDGLYDRLSCYDNLDLYARIYSIRNRRNKIYKLLEEVELSEESKKSVSALSKGMRQRLSFARAILDSPKIVFLAEPTSGLDPATTLKIHSLMRRLKEEGTTFFLTTHNMAEAQQMCGHIALLHEGRIVEDGTPEAICLRHRPECRVSIEMDDGNCYETDAGNLADLLQKIKKPQNDILRVHSNEPNLESVFIKITGRRLE